jgi:cobalt-zinc-cadmium efflux system outer membrane protein
VSRLRSLLTAVIGIVGAAPAAAQQPVTRADVVAAALSRGARALIGLADTAAASADVRAARLYPNPSLAGGYSKDPPHYHVLADVPLDLPWLRSARIGSARSSEEAARLGFAFERAAIRFEADTTYTGALAAAARARLSRRNAHDADSLVVMARLRREVGDVSELDVRLAEVNAGQLENVATDDSLAAVDGVLAVQLVMGLPAEQATIVLTDTLAPPPDSVPPGTGEMLPVAAATAGLEAASRSLTFARRNVFAAPSLQLGFDQNDPAGQRGPLPVIGVTLALPFFNQNGGEIAQAAAARLRARAELDLVRRETGAGRARARRSLEAALNRLARDRQLLEAADRVAAMSLQAYAEGAVPLANVLEAQRAAREALGRYVEDTAMANDAAAAVRLLETTEE